VLQAHTFKEKLPKSTNCEDPKEKSTSTFIILTLLLLLNIILPEVLATTHFSEIDFIAL
jgi:hypothetical protein